MRNTRINTEVFDANFVDANFGGQENIKITKRMISKCAAIFLDIVDQRFSALKMAIEHGDRKSVVMKSHQLKGTFLTLGSKKMGMIFDALEFNMENLSQEHMMANFLDAQESLPIFKIGLSEYLKRIG